MAIENKRQPIVGPIRQYIFDIIMEHPTGITRQEIMSLLRSKFPGRPENTFTGNLFFVASNHKDKIFKPSRAVYAAVTTEKMNSEKLLSEREESTPNREDDLYEPCAAFFREFFDEITNIEPLGGNKNVYKWGTPDVVGVISQASDEYFQFPTQIIAVEIKNTPSGYWEALGQAVTYRLFAHRTYVVVPKTPTKSSDEFQRLETLCALFGIGLFTFDRDSSPLDFQPRVPAQTTTPDIYYVRDFLDKLRRHEIFPKLFPDVTTRRRS